MSDDNMVHATFREYVKDIVVCKRFIAAVPHKDDEVVLDGTRYRVAWNKWEWTSKSETTFVTIYLMVQR